MQYALWSLAIRECIDLYFNLKLKIIIHFIIFEKRFLANYDLGHINSEIFEILFLEWIVIKCHKNAYADFYSINRWSTAPCHIKDWSLSKHVHLWVTVLYLSISSVSKSCGLQKERYVVRNVRTKFGSVWKKKKDIQGHTNNKETRFQAKVCTDLAKLIFSWP